MSGKRSGVRRTRSASRTKLEDAEAEQMRRLLGVGGFEFSFLTYRAVGRCGGR